MANCKIWLPSLIAALVPTTAFAADYRVTAQAVDSIGEPEMFTTYRIFTETDTIKPVAGAVTGDDGRINATLPSAGRYTMSVVGMSTETLLTAFEVSDEKPVASLGKLALMPSSTELQELTVTAQRPLVTKEIDRIGYDVQADTESKTSNLLDILRKVPMVSVEADGTIKVNGSSDFKIYKNGRPNNSFTKNAKDIFNAIPASSIKKIEVITDPGAREDAEGVGAILNIVTDNSTTIKGVVGTVSAYTDTRNGVPTPNLWLSTQFDKVTIALNGGYYNMNRRETKYTSVSNGRYASSGNELVSTGEGSSKSNSGYGGIEASYDIDTLNLMTAEFNFYYHQGNQFNSSRNTLTAPDGNVIYSYLGNSHYPKYSYFDFDGAFNYQHTTRRKGETVTLSYRISSTDQQQEQETEYTEVVNMPVPYSGIISDFDLNFIEHTFQADWSRPLTDKQKLDIGGKYILRNNHSKNRRDYIGSNETYDDFTHRTSIGALYADYRINFGKFNARAGLRYEYSRLSAKFKTGDRDNFGSSLNDFVPNVSVNYSPDEANTFKLSYNRRISRPGISYLDPTVSETPTVTSSGNPHLNSSSHNSINLNYNLIKSKINLDATIAYNFTNDMIDQVKNVVDDHSYYTYGNVNHMRGVSLNVYVQWSPCDKTQLMLNGSMGYSKVWHPGEDAKLNRAYVSPYVNISQKLPWKLQLRAYGGWWSGGINNVYSYNKSDASNIWYGLSLQRSFLKDDRLTVRVSTSQPFGPLVPTFRSYTVNSDYTAETASRYQNRRQFSLNVSYRFGSLSASVKKTAASISNDDLSGRKM